MGIFAKDPAAGDPTVLERDRSDSFESLLKLPVGPAPANTVIASGMTLTGTLQGEGTLHIEGKVVGELDIKGAVLVTKNGEVHGPIATDTIQVAGNVEGDITARQQLHLEANGSINGDISAAALIIENGGSFNGRSTMLKPSAPAAPAPAHDRQERQNHQERQERQERWEQPAPPPPPPPPQKPRTQEPPISSLLLDDDDDDDFLPRKR